MDTTPTPILQRHNGESTRAHEARCCYVEMGVDRSLDKVAQKLGKSSTLMARWSLQWRWVEAAQAWDDARAGEASIRAAEAYHSSLEDYRERYGKSGRGLQALASAYMSKLAQRIKDLDSSEITPGRLALDVRTVASALQVAGDLEAHALGIDRLLQQLDEGQP